MKVIAQGMKHWVPLFDKHNFTASFEHHTHYRKMSYPLKNATRDDEHGTRYLGDGSWGVPNDTCSDARIPKNINLLENYVSKEPNHIWQVTLKKVDNPTRPYSINYTAIDMGHNVAVQKVETLPALSG